jgi:hypothetical protein
VAVLVGQAAQPVDEPAGAMLVDVSEPLVRREVGQGVGDQQAPVLASRAVVDDVVGPTSGVVIDPLQRVGVQRRPGAPAGFLGGAPDLDLTRFAKGRRELLALAAVLAVDRHPARSSAVDPRM